jgi:hypothetical protein
MGHGTAYLISKIRCNNILIWILLHLILEIRYAVPYPCGREYHRYKYMKPTFIRYSIDGRFGAQ